MVSYPERAFLQLRAKRLLRLQREAEARGEEYHDLSPFAPLQCGIHVKFVFEAAPGGYIPVVFLRKWSLYQPKELQEIATYLLDGPAKLRESAGTDLEYVRETDAGTPAPE
jgi:hypothetical protein